MNSESTETPLSIRKKYTSRLFSKERLPVQNYRAFLTGFSMLSDENQNIRWDQILQEQAGGLTIVLSFALKLITFFYSAKYILFFSWVYFTFLVKACWSASSAHP
jgi:hypothetical protein